jgi:transposase
VSISERNDKSNDVASVRRLEIFTGVGRRRAWTAEQKAAIVAESVEEGGRVARRHGLTPQQLFAWRRQALRKTEVDVATPAFASVVVEAPSVAQSPGVGENKTGDARPHSIELDIDGSSVWVWSGAEVAMVRAIIGALKAAR